MSISKFDRSNVSTFNDTVEETLKTLAAEHGLVLERGNARYSGTSVTVKYTFNVTSSDGTASEPADFKRKARMLGLPEDCFGKTFTTFNGSYRITGINLRARKYPVQANLLDAKGNDTGKRYKHNEATVRRCLAA